VAFASAAALASGSARACALCAIFAKANSVTRQNASARVRCSCVACVRARAVAAHRHSGSSHECLCDIDVFFGRCFEEKPTEFIGQRFSSFIRDSPLLNQITLVPNENDAACVAVLINTTMPVAHVTKRILLALMKFAIAACNGEGKGADRCSKLCLKFLPHQ
jgi:hypothetical protein